MLEMRTGEFGKRPRIKTQIPDIGKRYNVILEHFNKGKFTRLRHTYYSTYYILRPHYVPPTFHMENETN